MPGRRRAAGDPRQPRLGQDPGAPAALQGAGGAPADAGELVHGQQQGALPGSAVQPQRGGGRGGGEVLDDVPGHGHRRALGPVRPQHVRGRVLHVHRQRSRPQPHVSAGCGRACRLGDCGHGCAYTGQQRPRAERGRESQGGFGRGRRSGLLQQHHARLVPGADLRRHNRLAGSWRPAGQPGAEPGRRRARGDGRPAADAGRGAGKPKRLDAERDAAGGTGGVPAAVRGGRRGRRGARHCDAGRSRRAGRLRRRRAAQAHPKHEQGREQ
mmetsp:Transcript_25047/g.85732  ORF Transcript_25047/g.85732 Transcript_25047/m.85732 type:complete len:269 (+) Transcript_25047:1154-1960(+)